MKTLKYIIAPGIILFLSQSCTEKPKAGKILNSGKSSSWEIIESDTVNRTDFDGFKQGRWTVKDWLRTQENHKLVLVESGNYVNNKKQGVWHYYDSTGKINRTVKYKNDFVVYK